MEPQEERNCNCQEMTCTKECVKNHTHKTFWCEKCNPVRYLSTLPQKSTETSESLPLKSEGQHIDNPIDNNSSEYCQSQNRPGDGRETWVDGRTDLLGFNPAKFLRSSIRQLKRYLPENERFQKEVENIAIAAKTVHNETVSSEIKLALAVYRDAIMGEKRFINSRERAVYIDDIERVSGEFGL